MEKTDPAPRVSAVLVSWNSREYLGSCLAALLAQELPLDEIILVDNGSSDGSADWTAANYPGVQVLRNSENLGFAAANNQGIAASSGHYALLVNTDAILEPGFVAVLVRALEADRGLGWASGKLLKLRDGERPGERRPAILDSTGEVIYRTRRALNRGDGEVDRGQYERREEVFGASAAAAIYRRAMLEDIRLGEDYFDADYFAYLEDCDLNWRAQLRGWRCLYDPAAMAHHVRQHPARRSVRIRRRAHFNRYLNLIKNETALNLVLALPHLAVYEAFHTLKTLVREPDVIAGVLESLPLCVRAWRKRRLIQKRRTASSRALRRWMQPEGYWRHLVKRLPWLSRRRSGESEPAPESVDESTIESGAPARER
jgi:GT2 family glycosyltransferase